jgi:hypothetical protein
LPSSYRLGAKQTTAFTPLRATGEMANAQRLAHLIHGRGVNRRDIINSIKMA